MTSVAGVAPYDVLVGDGAGEDRSVASVWVGELLVRVLRHLGGGGSFRGGSGTRVCGTLPDRQPPNLARNFAVWSTTQLESFCLLAGERMRA
jgi:hypothetical protein